MYEIYEQKSGRKVGVVTPQGEICCVEEHDQKRLQTFLHRDIVVRESEDGQEDEPVLEETMCFFGLKTLRPGDPEYLPAALQQLPLLTEYEAR